MDWESYPILRFSEIAHLTTMILPHPAARPLGAGEAVTGPAAGAIANAVAQATGVRFRQLPLTPGRIKAGLDEVLE